ncbi:phage head-tail connector protein [Lysinibacillus sp. CTST325]
MNEITPVLLSEFKGRMKLGDDEDDNLTRILKASVEDLQAICGDYDINISERFKELVFERSRYAYNEVLEFFTDNFSTQILNLSIAKAMEGKDE